MPDRLTTGEGGAGSVLTMEMLREAWQSLVGLRCLLPEITVAVNIEYTVRKACEPPDSAAFCAGPRIWVDKRLPSGTWHVGPPQEPIEDAW